MTTGDRIRLRRKEIGKSAEDIATQLGVSPATIYRYENGDIEKVPVDVVIKISEILSVSPVYLMGWSSEATETKKMPADASSADELDLAILSLVKQLPAEQKRFLLAQLRGVTGEK